MHPKPHFVYENKTIFIYFLAISGILHLIFVFSTSNISHLFKPELNLVDYGTKKGNYVVEIDLGSDEQKEEDLETDELAEEEEEEWIEADVREEMRQLFVDTSGRVEDEVPQAETNKIGEKGSVARDTYVDDNNINDKPRLDSESDFPGEAPDEFAAAVSQQSGMPIDVSLSEPVKDEAEEAVEDLVQEETLASLPDVDNGKELPVDQDVAEVEDEPVVQEESAVDVEEMDPQALSSQEIESVEDVEEIVSTELESDVVVLKPEPKDVSDTDTNVVEEEIEDHTGPVEEYTKTASIPKTLMKEIVEGQRESVANEAQNKHESAKPQVNNVPLGDDAPFFQDNISNAPLGGAGSFNVKKHEYAPYYKHIKDKIRLYWLLQYGTDASISQVTKGFKPIVVTFKVFPAGKILNVEIVDSAGNELLASKIRISIQNTILNKFPDYINEKYIDIKFSYFFF